MSLLGNKNDSTFDKENDNNFDTKNGYQNGHHLNGAESQLLTKATARKVIEKKPSKIDQKLLSELESKNASILLSESASDELIKIDDNALLFKQGRWYVVLYTDQQTGDQKTYTARDLNTTISEYKRKIRKKRSQGKAPLINHEMKLAYFSNLLEILKSYNNNSHEK